VPTKEHPVSEQFDMNALLRQAMDMQSKLAEAQEEAANAVVTGTAGGGTVMVTMTGAGEVTRVTLDPSVVDPADVDMLEDLIVAALHDAGAQVTALQRTAMGGLGDSLGGLGGLLGG
jgi:DNA-binding YbaB/EbfC family protein